MSNTLDVRNIAKMARKRKWNGVDLGKAFCYSLVQDNVHRDEQKILPAIHYWDTVINMFQTNRQEMQIYNVYDAIYASYRRMHECQATQFHEFMNHFNKLFYKLKAAVDHEEDLSRRGKQPIMLSLDCYFELHDIVEKAHAEEEVSIGEAMLNFMRYQLIRYLAGSKIDMELAGAIEGYAESDLQNPILRSLATDEAKSVYYTFQDADSRSMPAPEFGRKIITAVCEELFPGEIDSISLVKDEVTKSIFEGTSTIDIHLKSHYGLFDQTEAAWDREDLLALLLDVEGDRGTAARLIESGKLPIAEKHVSDGSDADMDKKAFLLSQEGIMPDRLLSKCCMNAISCIEALQQDYPELMDRIADIVKQQLGLDQLNYEETHTWSFYREHHLAPFTNVLLRPSSISDYMEALADLTGIQDIAEKYDGFGIHRSHTDHSARFSDGRVLQQKDLHFSIEDFSDDSLNDLYECEFALKFLYAYNAYTTALAEVYDMPFWLDMLSNTGYIEEQIKNYNRLLYKGYAAICGTAKEQFSKKKKFKKFYYTISKERCAPDQEAVDEFISYIKANKFERHIIDEHNTGMSTVQRFMTPMRNIQ